MDVIHVRWGLSYLTAHNVWRETDTGHDPANLYVYRFAPERNEDNYQLTVKVTINLLDNYPCL